MPCPITFSPIKLARHPNFAPARERQTKASDDKPVFGPFPASNPESPRPRRGVRRTVAESKHTTRAADPPAIQPHPHASPSQQAARPCIAATSKPERYV